MGDQKKKKEREKESKRWKKDGIFKNSEISNAYLVKEVQKLEEKKVNKILESYFLLGLIVNTSHIIAILGQSEKYKQSRKKKKLHWIVFNC